MRRPASTIAARGLGGLGVLCVLGLSLLAGCGGGETRPPLCKTTGTLLYDGKPAVGALSHVPRDDEAGDPVPAAARRPCTRDGGVFDVETCRLGRWRRPEGEYIVTVDWHTSTGRAWRDAENDVKSLVPRISYLVMEKSSAQRDRRERRGRRLQVAGVQDDSLDFTFPSMATASFG